MSAVERLQAAIEKLEALKASSTPGPWRHHDYGTSGAEEPQCIIIHSGKFDWPAISHGEYIAGTPTWDAQPNDDATLIVTLHRTIDAQLAILRGARSDINVYGGARFGWHQSAIYLADAILGGA